MRTCAILFYRISQWVQRFPFWLLSSQDVFPRNRWTHSEIRRDKTVTSVLFWFSSLHSLLTSLCAAQNTLARVCVCSLTRYSWTRTFSPLLKRDVMDSPLSSLSSSEDEQDTLTHLQNTTCLDLDSATLPLNRISPCARCAKGVLDEECRFQS